MISTIDFAAHLMCDAGRDMLAGIIVQQRACQGPLWRCFMALEGKESGLTNFAFLEKNIMPCKKNRPVTSWGDENDCIKTMHY